MADGSIAVYRGSEGVEAIRNEDYWLAATKFGDAALRRSHSFHKKKPPTPSPATTSSVKKTLINLGSRSRESICRKSGLGPSDSLFNFYGHTYCCRAQVKPRKHTPRL